MDPITIISIIIALFNAMPQIVADIEEVIALIRQWRVNRAQEAQIHTQTLLGLLQAYHASNDGAALQHGLGTLRAGMVVSAATPP